MSDNIRQIENNIVTRNAQYWSPAVRDLLLYLQNQGFPYSPQHLGINLANHTERLSLVKGKSGKDIWERIVSEEGLIEHAKLLRAYHDAVAGYRPNGKILWAFGEQELRANEIICHNDFGPWNTVWQDDKPVGIIDWDLAAPGRVIDDIAYALEYAAPFRDDEECLKWHHFPEVPDRKRRVEIFLKAYGIDWAGSMPDEVARIQRRDIERVKYLAAQNIEPQKSWVIDDKFMNKLKQRITWTEQNRQLFK